MNQVTGDQQEFKKQTPDTDLEIIDKRHTALEPAVQEPTDIVMMAIERKLDPALIEKMMDLAERQERNIAKKAYVAAMAAFKANPPKIYKKKKAGFDHKSGQGRTEYSFAPLPDICEAIDPALSAQGLHYDWVHDQDEKEIIVTCIMTHDLGYSKQTTLRAPRDDSGKKNFIQSMGSTISYLERYTLLGIAGLATHEMDDDGATSSDSAQDEFITEDQAKEISKRLKVVYGKKIEAYLEYFGVETVDTISAKDYDEAIAGVVTAEKAYAEHLKEKSAK